MNTMMIGQTVTGIQIISPIISVIVLSIRAFNILKYKSDSIESMCEFDFIVVNTNLFIIYTVLIITLISILMCFDF